MGFHEGELAVQRRAGTTAAAARLTGMLAPADLRGGFARFLADRTFAALAARDGSGRLWVSPLTGEPGFLRAASATVLAVGAAPVAGDPLHGLPAGQPVGLVVVEFATRRRVRVNGVLAAAGRDGLTVEVEQAYGNCPQYIQQRTLAPAASAPGVPVRRGAHLTADDIASITRADTFFVGTGHPHRGADASHRGGPPGFVRVTDSGLWWPDYPGNNMFNTLGNLASDPSAALLFPDFDAGATVQLSGSAAVEWTAPGGAGDDGGTGRIVRFTVDEVVAGPLLPVHGDGVVPYRLNPPVTV